MTGIEDIERVVDYVKNQTKIDLREPLTRKEIISTLRDKDLGLRGIKSGFLQTAIIDYNATVNKEGKIMLFGKIPAVVVRWPKGAVNFLGQRIGGRIKRIFI